MPLNKQCGWAIKPFVNQDYWCHGGLISFKAELLQNDKVIDDWTHFLWADIINIQNPTPNEPVPK